MNAGITETPRIGAVTLGRLAAEDPWRLIFGVDAGGGLAAGHEAKVGVRISASLAHRLLKRGVSSNALGPFSRYLGLGRVELADMLDVHPSTVARWAAREQLLPAHAAEALIRWLELDLLATDTFQTEAEARRWLREPQPMLEGEAPRSAAKSSYGAKRVRDILAAIKYGGVA